MTTSIRSKCTIGKSSSVSVSLRATISYFWNMHWQRHKNPINVHLSLYVPKERTEIEGDGTTFSLVDLWLSPVLFSKFLSISPTTSKETIDRTPRATEKNQLISLSRFSFRTVEYVSLYVTLSFVVGCVCVNDVLLRLNTQHTSAYVNIRQLKDLTTSESHHWLHETQQAQSPLLQNFCWRQ